MENHGALKNIKVIDLSRLLPGPTVQFPERGNALISHRYACYNTYVTADGREISLGAVENRFYRQICEHLGKPEFIALQYDENRRQELIDFFRTAFKQKTLAEWEKELAHVDACWATIRNIGEALEDPLFIEREMVVTINTNDQEPSIAIGVPVKLSDTPGSVRTAAVAFGESTAEVLKDVGYSEDDIRFFASKQAV